MPKKQQQEKSLSSFYFHFLQPGDAITGFLESAVGRGIGFVVRICRVVSVHARLRLNAGRRLYRVRRLASAPENAYPRSGYGSGRKVGLCSSNEQVSSSYRSPTRNCTGGIFPERRNLDLASRRRCSPSEWRSRFEGSYSAGEQRRKSYTRFQPWVASGKWPEPRRGERKMGLEGCVLSSLTGLVLYSRH